MNAMTKVSRVHCLADGRFESRDEYPTNDLLGIDGSLREAVSTAVREAGLISEQMNCRVVVEVQEHNGKFKQEEIKNPTSKAKDEIHDQQDENA